MLVMLYPPAPKNVDLSFLLVHKIIKSTDIAYPAIDERWRGGGADYGLLMLLQTGPSMRVAG